MFVQTHMTRNPKTIGPAKTVMQASQLMRDGGFHELPVVDGNGNLLGIVTDRDIRSALGYGSVRQVDLKVEEIMTCDPICISQDSTIEEAVRLSCTHRFGAFPVMNGKLLVGIISRSDLLRAFHDLLGLHEAGSRLEVAIPNGTADLARIISSLSEEDEICSMVAGRLREDGDEPVLYIRTRLPNPLKLERRLKANGAIILAPERKAVLHEE